MDIPLFSLWYTLALGLLLSYQRPESSSIPQANVPPSAAHAEAEGLVRLTPKALHSLSLKTAPVERRALTEAVRVTAVIKPNEDRLAHVSPRIPGRVVQVHKLLGDRVKDGDVLAVLDSVELAKAKAGYLKFQALTTESYPEERFHGTVTYIGSLLNETTRTVPARVEIPNPQGRLKPGMFASAIVASQGQSAATGLTVPASAVQRIAGETVVFVPQ